MKISYKEACPFSLDEREYPVYNKKNIRIGNCKKILFCKTEERRIRISTNKNQDENRLKRFIKRFINNNVFLQVTDSEECIALRPWNLEHAKNMNKDNYVIPEYGATYFIIPSHEYAKVEENSLIGIGKYSSSEVILLKIPADYLEDLSKYPFFEIIGEKTKLLK